MSKIIQEITADGLHLPKALVEQLGWRDGTKVILEIHERTVSIVPQEFQAEEIAEIACFFLLEEVGDAAAIKKPQKKDDKWIVDVLLPHTGKDLGTLVFTTSGKLMSDESDSPSQLLEKANEN